MQTPSRTTGNIHTQFNNLYFEVYFRPLGNRGPITVTLQYCLLKMSVAVHTLITNRNICHLGVKVRY